MNPSFLIRLSSPEPVSGLHEELAQGAKWFLRDQGEIQVDVLGPFWRDGRGRSPAETSVLLVVSSGSARGLHRAVTAQQLEEILRVRAKVASPEVTVTVMWAAETP